MENLTYFSDHPGFVVPPTVQPNVSVALTTEAARGMGATLEDGVTAAAGSAGEVATGGVNLDVVTKAFSVYVLLLMVINVCLNGLVLFAVLYLQRARLRSSQLVLLQLSISDLLIALLYLPFLLVLLLRDSAVADCRLLCAALAALERGLIAASIWGIAFVSLDRYLYIVKHSSYKTAMTMRRSLGGVAVVWIIALLFGTTSFMVSAHFRDESGACVCHLTLDFYGFYHLMYSAGYITLCFILPTTLMLVFYGFVMRVAQRRETGCSKNPFRKPPDRENIRYSPTMAGHGKSGYPLEPNAGHSSGLPWSQVDAIHLHKVKAARILFIVITLYIACITPYFIINIALATGHWNPRGFPHVIYLGSILLLHSNSSCNPLFYGFANRRLRVTLTDYIRRKLRRSGVVAKAEYHAKRGRTNSRISIMGESSDCSVGNNLVRRMSASSDISALSCMSREAFVGRDLLDIYTSGGCGGCGRGAGGCGCGCGGGHGTTSVCGICGLHHDATSADDSGLEQCVCAKSQLPCRPNRSLPIDVITNTTTTAPTTASVLSSSNTPAGNDPKYWTTSAAADNPATSSWPDVQGEETETDRMIVLTSGVCQTQFATQDGPRSGASVPIRRPLETKRAAVLSHIAEAGTLFGHEEGGQRGWTTSPLSTMSSISLSPNTDSVLSEQGKRDEPAYVCATAE